VFVTTTSFAPAVRAGVTHVITVPDTTETDVADAPPIVTVAPAENPVPVMETDVPPAVLPVLGVTLLTVGAAARPSVMLIELAILLLLEPVASSHPMPP